MLHMPYNRYCDITSAADCLIVKDTMAESKVENVGFKQLRKVTECRYLLPAHMLLLERHQTECRAISLPPQIGGQIAHLIHVQASLPTSLTQ